MPLAPPSIFRLAEGFNPQPESAVLNPVSDQAPPPPPPPEQAAPPAAPPAPPAPTIPAPSEIAPPTPTPPPRSGFSPGSIQSLIFQQAQARGMDPYLALATAQAESGYNIYAVGDNGMSHGLYQEHMLGRGAGRAPDYDPTNQVNRFLDAVGGVNGQGKSPGQIAALAQRPANPQAYANTVNQIYARLTGGAAPSTPFPSGPPPPNILGAIGQFGHGVEQFAGGLPVLGGLGRGLADFTTAALGPPIRNLASLPESVASGQGLAGIRQENIDPATLLGLAGGAPVGEAGGAVAGALERAGKATAGALFDPTAAYLRDVISTGAEAAKNAITTLVRPAGEAVGKEANVFYHVTPGDFPASDIAPQGGNPVFVSADKQAAIDYAKANQAKDVAGGAELHVHQYSIDPGARTLDLSKASDTDLIQFVNRATQDGQSLQDGLQQAGYDVIKMPGERVAVVNPLVLNTTEGGVGGKLLGLATGEAGRTGYPDWLRSAAKGVVQDLWDAKGLDSSQTRVAFNKAIATVSDHLATVAPQTAGGRLSLTPAMKAFLDQKVPELGKLADKGLFDYLIPKGPDLAATAQQSAREIADDVAKTGLAREMPYLSPQERAVVHRTLAEDARVRTESTGEGDKRVLTVHPAGTGQPVSSLEEQLRQSIEQRGGTIPEITKPPVGEPRAEPTSLPVVIQKIQRSMGRGGGSGTLLSESEKAELKAFLDAHGVFDSSVGQAAHGFGGLKLYLGAFDDQRWPGSSYITWDPLTDRFTTHGTPADPRDIRQFLTNASFGRYGNPTEAAMGTLKIFGFKPSAMRETGAALPSGGLPSAEQVGGTVSPTGESGSELYDRMVKESEGSRQAKAEAGAGGAGGEKPPVGGAGEPPKPPEPPIAPQGAPINPEEQAAKLAASVPIGRRVVQGIGEAVLQTTNIPRSLQLLWHLTAPLNNGILFAGRREWYQALAPMVRSFLSEGATDRIAASLTADPQWSGVRDKLMGVQMRGLTDPLTRDESQISGHLLENIPKLGGVFKMGNRAFNTYMNVLNDGVARSMYQAFSKTSQGVTPERLQWAGNYINTLTGRAHIPGMTPSGERALSNFLFAPRFMFSGMMAPVKVLGAIASGDRAIMGQAAHDLVYTGAILGTAMGAAKAMGWNVDPIKGEISKGAVHIGLYGPMSIYGGIYRALTSKDVPYALGTFGIERLNTGLQMAYEAAKGKTVTGQKIAPDQMFDQVVIQNNIPIFVQTMRGAIDQARQDGWSPELGVGLGLAPFAREHIYAPTQPKAKAGAAPSGWGQFAPSAPSTGGGQASKGWGQFLH